MSDEICFGAAACFSLYHAPPVIRKWKWGKHVSILISPGEKSELVYLVGEVVVSSIEIGRPEVSHKTVPDRDDEEERGDEGETVDVDGGGYRALP